MENSPATGQDEGRLPGVGGKGPLSSGHVEGRRLGGRGRDRCLGFFLGLLSRGVWMEGVI